MIDPNNINTIRVGQLVEAVFSGTDNIPHEVGTDLRRGTIADLATYIAGVIDASGGLAFLPIAVVDGQELPPTTTNEWFLAGKGTYTQTGGYPDIVCDEGLSVIIGNGTFWSLGVSIPIVVDPADAMISQTVNAGVTNYSPSEDAVRTAIDEIAYLNAMGTFHYADLATQTVPISVTSGVETKLTNDADGIDTNVNNAPFGVSGLWNPSTNQFDFTQLAVGDVVHFRPDLSIDLTGTNTSYKLYMKMAIGGLNPWTLNIHNGERKSTDEFDENIFVGFDIASEETKDFPAEIYILTDAGATVKVNGWYFEVIRKNINLIDVGEIPQSKVTNLITDLANTLHKTGDETKSGKLNLSNVNLYLVPSPIFSGLTDTGVAGNLNGLYYYSVNYYNALGETDTSGEQSISVTNKQVSVTLPISPNTSVIGRRLYRTVANAFDPVIKYLVADIPNNTATSYVDNIIDGSLGVPVPRVNTTGGQLFNNADRVGFASGGTTSFGLNSALQSTGYANSSFGFGSLTDNTTGYRNTAGGVFSMYKNTTGYNNTGWGVHSLNDNTTGWDNSAFGFSALISNTTGISNSAFGTFALSQNLTGSNNVAVGPSSLQYNTAGNNTAVGYNSLQNNTTGSGNIGLGYQAGRDNSTGNFNIVIGQSALEKMNDAWFTTAIGFQTGFNATSLAWSNTFIGAESGYNASGGNNVFLGKAAGYYETGSNKLFIDNQQRANESDARISALIYGEFNATVSSQQLAVNGNLKVNGVVKLKNYTVSTLPAGTQGDTAYVTDALTPTYLTAVVGGGSVICPVFHNGTTWVSH